MLGALLQAQHEAVPRAGFPPSPSGSLPAPLSTQPSSPGSELYVSHPGVAVIRKRQKTIPLHPPSSTAKGDKRRRQANKKPHVEYWHELLAYIDAVYRKKFGRQYPWNNLARLNIHNLGRVHYAWRVMALWDLYLESESWWARRTGCSVYGMIRGAGRLMDDTRFRQLAGDHGEALASLPMEESHEEEPLESRSRVLCLGSDGPLGLVHGQRILVASENDLVSLRQWFAT